MEIIDMYDTPDSNDSEEMKKLAEDPEEMLIKLLENNMRNVVSIPNKVVKQHSNEEDSDLVKIRKNILSQYAQVRYLNNLLLTNSYLPNCVK